MRQRLVRLPHRLHRERVAGSWPLRKLPVAERRAVQDGILAFQSQWNRYVESSNGAWPNLADVGSERLAGIVVSALRAPTPDEAAVFGNWQHEDNFGSSVVTGLLSEDLVAAIPYMSPSNLDDLHMRDSFWPALIAASDTRLSAAARAVTEGRVDPAMFDPSGEPFESHLHYRTADNKWHEGSSRPVRINHNGLSFVRLDFEAGYVDVAALSIPGRPAIVRVDWIEAKVIAGGRRVPDVLRWDRPEDFAGLTYREARWLGSNMVAFDAPDAALWLPLAARCGDRVTSAQITVAFAMLPRSMSGFGHRLRAARG